MGFHLCLAIHDCLTLAETILFLTKKWFHECAFNHENARGAQAFLVAVIFTTLRVLNPQGEALAPIGVGPMNTQIQFSSKHASNDFVNRLSDADLLGELIGVQESRQQYQGSLQPFFAEGQAQSHTKCAVARELVKRWLYEEMTHREVFADPRAVVEFLKVHFAGREYESFVVLYLDSQNRLIAVEELFKGTLSQTSVYPREVVKNALRHNAGACVLSHNHPSGVVTASRADEHLTQILKSALSLVDVRVLDHIIVAGNRSLSFAEKGLL